MTSPHSEDLHIPSVEELHRSVKPRREDPRFTSGVSTPDMPTGSDAPPDLVLSPRARSFLHHAAEPHHRDLGLEERWGSSLAQPVPAPPQIKVGTGCGDKPVVIIVGVAELSLSGARPTTSEKSSIENAEPD